MYELGVEEGGRKEHLHLLHELREEAAPIAGLAQVECLCCWYWVLGG